MKYGYARVSTDGQSVDAQVRQLKAAGCKTVFREVASGAKTDRAQLRRLLDQLDAEDVVTVTRLDRTVLGGLAEFERDLIRSWTGEGSERAKARGVKMGRKPKLNPHQRAEAIRRKESGEAVREIARSYNVHNTNLSATFENAGGRQVPYAQRHQIFS
jgi:DNA invertase Pin-like site-specific DNA recombinase